MAKPKALPQGVLNSKQMLNKINKESDSLGLVLLYGTETYMIDGAVNMLKKVCLGPGAEDMDFASIDTRTGEKFDMGKLEELISMPPWMSPKRLIVVRQSGLPGRELSDKDLNVLKNIPSSTVVVFFEENVDSRKKAFKAFVQYGTVASMAGFEEDELLNWIGNRFGKEGLKVNYDAATSMASRCSGNMMELVNEVNKVALYCQSKNYTVVTPEIVELCCPADLSGRIFDIMDSCGSGNAASALGTLDKLIINKEPMVMIRASIMSHIKALIMAKEAGNPNVLIKRTGMKEFRAKKICQQANNFSMNSLIKLYLTAADLDSDFRHGLIDERYSLEIVLVKAAAKTDGNPGSFS
ncbi:DNA polymerase III subunit delta [Butyrivibrio sp. AE2032]|uniref:DNA polymerase III subunit delta n=1 Tax=Butyrivibrio sp. AE2032 TaxID=1458463 RepID=UPI00054CDC0E|nr:DNA polymerase III subunit delta [Butyrivibrio sp. AE2032]